jgi:hypothetical protein
VGELPPDPALVLLEDLPQLVKRKLGLGLLVVAEVVLDGALARQGFDPGVALLVASYLGVRSLLLTLYLGVRSLLLMWHLLS